MSEAKLNIQWFPGHMTKAKRAMQEKLKAVDFVIEIRDARIPSASKNPMIDEIIGKKPRMILLSKKDKANADATKAWIAHLEDDSTSVLAFDFLNEELLEPILKRMNHLLEANYARLKRRGIQPRAMRAMVVGIPNVGKSTFINQISKRKVAKTGDRPGVTKALQWIKVGKHLELLDTPGVLWPKFEDEQVGVLLAITGAIRDEILPIDELAYRAMQYLLERHADLVEKRYQLEILEDPYEMLLSIARKRGYLRAGNTIDEKRMYESLLREIRDNQLGAITWELPCED